MNRDRNERISTEWVVKVQVERTKNINSLTVQSMEVGI